MSIADCQHFPNCGHMCERECDANCCGDRPLSMIDFTTVLEATEREVFNLKSDRGYTNHTNFVPSATLTAIKKSKLHPVKNSLTDEQIDLIRCSTLVNDFQGLPQSTDTDYVVWHKSIHVRAFARAIEVHITQLTTDRTTLLAGKLELVIAERDKLQRELADLRVADHFNHGKTGGLPTDPPVPRAELLALAEKCGP